MDFTTKYGFLVRLHNLPRNSGLGKILHFLWQRIIFEPDEATIRAFSVKNAIVGFTKEKLAEEAVQFCNGKTLDGRVVTVHPASVADIARVVEDAKLDANCPPPVRLPQNKHLDSPELDKENDENEDGEGYAFMGLTPYSDEDSDEMDLMVPDWFKRGAPPDTIKFEGRHHSGGSQGMGSTNDSSSHSASISPDVVESTANDHKRPAPAPSGSPLVGPSVAKRARQQPAPPLAAASAAAGRPPPSHSAASSVAATSSAQPRMFYPPPPPSPQMADRRNVPSPSQFAANNLRNSPVIFSTRLAGKAPATAKIEIHYVISSTAILLNWTLPNSVAELDRQLLKVTCDAENFVETKQFGRSKVQRHLMRTIVEGRTYKATVQGFDVHSRQLALGNCEFRAHYSINEIRNLFKRALEFCGNDLLYPFEVLHRSKPRAYFEAIYDQPDGLRIMRPYTKDENGHPGCPINGTLEGFFFSTLLTGSSLPTFSPFGDVQMVMKVDKMLNFDHMNMYFADFYCNEAYQGVQGVSSVLHYITVVVCRCDSAADRYSRERLIKLEPQNNKFLKVLSRSKSADGQVQYLCNAKQGLLVEVFFTEPISLFDALKFREVQPLGKGSSCPMGLPNNKYCTTCNTNPLTR